MGGHAHDLRGVPPEDLGLSPPAQIPKPDRAVMARRRKSGGAGDEREPDNPARVALQDLAFPAGLRIPEAGRLVLAGGGQGRPVGAEGDAGDLGSCPSRSGSPPRWPVPGPRRAVQPAGGDLTAVGAERTLMIGPVCPRKVRIRASRRSTRGGSRSIRPWRSDGRRG